MDLDNKGMTQEQRRDIERRAQNIVQENERLANEKNRGIFVDFLVRYWRAFKELAKR